MFFLPYDWSGETRYPFERRVMRTLLRGRVFSGIQQSDLRSGHFLWEVSAISATFLRNVSAFRGGHMYGRRGFHMNQLQQLQQIIHASLSSLSLLQSASSAQPDADWLDLDYQSAQDALADLVTAKNALEMLKSVQPEMYDRAWNTLEYTFGTISIEHGDKAKAHAGRARSSVSQLSQLAETVEEIIQSL